MEKGIHNKVNPFWMLDLEAISTEINGSIIEIGLGLWTGEEVITWQEYVEPDYSRSNQSTLDWWETQPHWPTIQAEIEGPLAAGSVEEAMRELRRQIHRDGFLEHYKNEDLTWWANGCTFDMGMLVAQLGQNNCPWNFRKIRCMRNVFGQHGRPKKLPFRNTNAHSAAADCEFQIKVLVHMFQRMNYFDINTGEQIIQPS